MSSSPRFAAVANLLGDAVARRVFPCATIEVGGRDDVFWRHACGTLSYDDAATPATLDTVFDLASLTKVLATTTLVMQLVDEGAIRLDDTVGRWLKEWRGEDRSAVTVADLLEHAGGLTAHLPFFRDHQGRGEFQHAICTLPLEYPPRSQSVYSDLGFILLAFLVADAAGRAGDGIGIPIDDQFDQLARRLELGDLRYRPPAAWRPRTAPTEVDSWRGRLLRGEVHDENGWALGGVAGHTGLFGTAPAVGRFARALLEDARRRRAPRQPGDARAVPATEHRAGQLTRPRVGHDAGHLVLRPPAVARRHRTHRVHRLVTVDRPAPGSVCRAADQPGVPHSGQRGDPRAAPRRP